LFFSSLDFFGLIVIGYHHTDPIIIPRCYVPGVIDYANYAHYMLDRRQRSRYFRFSCRIQRTVSVVRSVNVVTSLTTREPKSFSGRRTDRGRPSIMACEACNAKFNLFKRKVSGHFRHEHLALLLRRTIDFKGNPTIRQTPTNVALSAVYSMSLTSSNCHANVKCHRFIAY